ncbi:SAM-dependent methyltransferase [Hydrogenophaga sp. D2P1]|uniref:SAM-dependent methyltransferase n=1 Tax=Hydrogenophaga aromaticivorans TaxID=2610898 RepID=A0A7Y8KXG8_9BURK|nr:SAM-dependent methyltransferase [Hydrogenophaga aromaticivorans]NWF46575.1 SAM-dependent methyltransferase [Hydrogenophaga aromaticivorans]
MPGYEVRQQTVNIGGLDYDVRSLLDNQQYADPLGSAEDAGMGASGWPLFGQVWPSARVLALAMHSHAIEGKRILEIGAGLALASLVIHRRAGDVTVTDWHPLTETFLQENLLANGLGPLPYQPGNWALDDASGASGLGRFDLIIGSDVLYERQQPAQLARFIDQHATLHAEIIIVDPDRSNRSAFCREMAALGYRLTMRTADKTLEGGETYKGRFLTFRR